MASRGIPALVRRLRGGTTTQQLNASIALLRMLIEGSQETEAAAAEAMAAAGAIPVLLQIVRTSQHDQLLQQLAATTLALLAHGAQRAQTIVAGGAVPPLVRLMASDNVDLQSGATMLSPAQPLLNLTVVSSSGDSATRAAD